jgi:hypothetical protein
MRRSRLYRALIVAGSFFLASHGQAQSSFEPGGFMYFNHIQNAAWVNAGINPAVDDLKYEPSRRIAPAAKITAAPKLTPAALASLSFTASTQRRAANLDKIFASFDAKMPGVGSQLKAEFTNSNVFAAVEKAMAVYGMRADSIADTFAMFWVASWQAAHSVEAEPSKASVAAVKRQAAQAMLAVDQITAMSPADKQEMADGLIVSLVMLTAAQEGAKADPSMKKMLAKQAMTDAQQLGLDHNVLTLTDAGFVPAS